MLAGRGVTQTTLCGPQVARGLAEQHKLYAQATEGGLEGGEPHLDVLHEGFAFRLFLLYERDAPPPHVQCHTAPAFRAAHAAMLQPLQTRFPAYSATVCKWEYFGWS